MKIRFTSLFIIACCIWSEQIGAKAVSQNILSSAGGTDIASGIRLDWTLGEAAIASYQDGASMYTEGFHQPMLPVPANLSTSTESPTQPLSTVTKWNGTIAIYPNPVAHHVTIDIPSTMESVIITVFQLQGASVMSELHPAEDRSVKLDFSNLASGLYLICIRDQSHHLLYTHTISKI